jgi:hypothetical protein
MQKIGYGGMGLVPHFTLDRTMKQQQQYDQSDGQRSSGHAEDITVFMRFHHQLNAIFSSLLI